MHLDFYKLHKCLMNAFKSKITVYEQILMIINIIAISTLATTDLCNSCANNVLLLSPQ